MTYSKYHTDTDVPFPGADAVTLAVGMPELHRSEDQRIGFVFDSPACIDCAFCHDAETPNDPDAWMCWHGGVRPCFIARGFTTMCGQQARWFIDALAGVQDDNDAK